MYFVIAELINKNCYCKHIERRSMSPSSIETASEQGTTDADDLTGNLSFDDVFKSLLRSLPIFGLYFRAETTTSGKVRWTAGRVYGAVVVVMLWLFFLRTLMPFQYTDNFGPQLFNKLAATTWAFLCASQGTAMHISSLKTFPRFKSLWNELEETPDFEFMTKFKDCLFVSVVLGWFLHTSNVLLGIAIGMFTNTMAPMLLPFLPGELLFVVSKITILIGAIWMSSAWIFSSITNILIARYLRYKFISLRIAIQTAVEDFNQKRAALDLKYFRQKHEQVTRLVQCADVTLQWQMVSVVVCNIAIVCLTLYELIWYIDVNEAPTVIGNLFWMVVTSTTLFTIVGYAYRVHAEVGKGDIEAEVNNTKDASNVYLINHF